MGEIRKYSIPVSSVDKVLIVCFDRVFVSQIACRSWNPLTKNFEEKSLFKAGDVAFVLFSFIFFYFVLLDINPAQCEHQKSLLR